jgi:hypothetical protein
VQHTCFVAGLAQLVEHLICNQAVGGSIPLASSILVILSGEVPEWLNGADCKSAVLRLRQFESAPPHHAGVAQLARASAFQAEC